MKKRVAIFLFSLIFLNHLIGSDIDSTISNYVKGIMPKTDIPGLTIVYVIKGNYKIQSFGYANIDTKQKIDSNTIFQLGSCSKAFTALAIKNLESRGKLDVNKNVSYYLPWFKVKYDDKYVNVKVKHLLYHTSGIPQYTISLIPPSNKKDALESTIKKIVDIELHDLPGKQYEYASINYDILALIIEKITGKSYENYMDALFVNNLDLHETKVGEPFNSDFMSTGYKIGFFKPRLYNAPIYKGNNAAGYIFSNGVDMAKWLMYQMNTLHTEFDSLISLCHIPDNTVMPQDFSSYAYGWRISLKGDNTIFHNGLNPNFTSHISFRVEDGIGVVVLANSNSSYTRSIGQDVMKILDGEEDVKSSFIPDNLFDTILSVVVVLLGIYLLITLTYFGYIIFSILKGKRSYEAITFRKAISGLLVLLLLFPFIYGMCLLPKALLGFTWDSSLVWFPKSFIYTIIFCLSSIAISYFIYLIELVFPSKNQYLKDAPKIMLLSILSGLSNTILILIITSSLNSSMEFKFMLYYFFLVLAVFLIGRKYVQTKMVYLTRTIIYNLRMKLIGKIFTTSFEKFEKLDRGRVYSTMNDDIGTIGDSANMFISISTSLVTAIGAFIYMATLAFWSTIITILLVGAISTIYYFVSRNTQSLFSDARETRTVYMRLLNGLIDGFKELSIHINKKLEFRDDIERVTDDYRNKISRAHVKFVNASLVGDSLLISVLAIVVFLIPSIFPNIQFFTIMNFIILLLYLIGPVNMILGSIPQFLELRIAKNRIQGFMSDIPQNLNLQNLIEEKGLNDQVVNSFRVNAIKYSYDSIDDQKGFSVGPISFQLNRGEVLFIVGGNGSGKTTLAKLITGLYTSHEGEIYINNNKIKQNCIGEYFSAVFNPSHLFKKLYNINFENENRNRILDQLLKTLELENKVTINNNEFSTIDLSGGQRKRLLLLICYLEDRPIFLFDEWAADQDPCYRKIFYHELLPQMKKEGKMIIVITHDDHYFDVADKILELDYGQGNVFENSFEFKKDLFPNR